VRCKPKRADLGDEPFGVVALVPSDGPPPWRVRQTSEHLDRPSPLGVAVGDGQLGIDDQRVAVFHQQVTGEAQRGCGVVALAIQPGLGVGRRGMRVVGAALAGEADLGVGPSGGVRWRSVLRLERLVLRRHVAAQLRLAHDGGEEPVSEVMLEEAFAVLGEHGGIEGRPVDAHVKNHLNSKS
jgi:hypothetical protein